NDETRKAHDNEQRALEAEKHAEEEAGKAREEERQKDRQLTRAEWLVYAGQLERAQQHWEQGNVAAAQDLLEKARWDYRGVEHRHLHPRFNASLLTFHGHTLPVTSVAFSPDGTRLASFGNPAELKLWDVASSTKGRQAGSTKDRQAGGQQALELKGHTG